jgi:hypothetical protein
MAKARAKKTMSKRKSKAITVRKAPSKDLMPSGILRGDGRSYAQRMSLAEFKKLAEHWIEMAKVVLKVWALGFDRAH